MKPVDAANAPVDEGGMRPRKRFSPWRLVPVVVLLAGLVVAYAFGLTRYLSLDALRENRELLLGLLERNWPAAALLYIAVYAAAIAFSLPGGVFLTIVGGFMFGPYWGTLLVVVAATAGATALFLAARYLLGDALRERAGPALQRMEAGFRDNAVSYMFVLRLVPLFPFWLVNLVPACLGVPLGTYVFTTFFGIMPGSFVYASVGDGLGAILEVGGAPDTGAIFRPRFLVPILGLVALALLPVAYKWFRGRGRAD